MRSRRIAFSKDWLLKQLQQSVAMARAGHGNYVKGSIPYLPSQAVIGNVSVRDNQDVVVVEVYEEGENKEPHPMNVREWEIPENFLYSESRAKNWVEAANGL